MSSERPLAPWAVVPSADVALNSRSFGLALPDAFPSRSSLPAESASAFFSSATRKVPPPYSAVFADEFCRSGSNSHCRRDFRESLKESSTCGEQSCSVSSPRGEALEKSLERMRCLFSAQTAAGADAFLRFLQSAFCDVFESELLPQPSSFAGRAAVIVWEFCRSQLCALRRIITPKRAASLLAFALSPSPLPPFLALWLIERCSERTSSDTRQGALALCVQRTEEGGGSGFRAGFSEELLLAEGCSSDRSVAIDGGGCVMLSRMQGDGLGKMDLLKEGSDWRVPGALCDSQSELVGCAASERIVRNSGRVESLIELFDLETGCEEKVALDADSVGDESLLVSCGSSLSPTSSLSLAKRLRVDGRKVTATLFLHSGHKPHQPRLLVGFSDGSIQLLRRCSSSPSSFSSSSPSGFSSWKMRSKGREGAVSGSWSVEWSDCVEEAVMGFCSASAETGLNESGEGPVVFAWSRKKAFLFAPLEERSFFFPPSSCQVSMARSVGGSLLSKAFRSLVERGSISAVSSACFTSRSEIAVLSRDGVLDFFKVRIERQSALAQGKGGPGFAVLWLGGISLSSSVRLALRRGGSSRLFHSRLLEALLFAVEGTSSLYVLRCRLLSTTEKQNRVQEGFSSLVPSWMRHLSRRLRESFSFAKNAETRGCETVQSDQLSVHCVEWTLPRLFGATEASSAATKKSEEGFSSSSSSSLSLDSVRDFAFAEDCTSGSWFCAVVLSNSEEVVLLEESVSTSGGGSSRECLSLDKRGQQQTATSVSDFGICSKTSEGRMAPDTSDLLLRRAPSLKHRLLPPIKGAIPLGVVSLDLREESASFLKNPLLAVRWAVACSPLLENQISEYVPAVVCLYRIPVIDAFPLRLPMWRPHSVGGDWKNCLINSDPHQPLVDSLHSRCFFDLNSTAQTSTSGFPPLPLAAEAGVFSRLPLSMSALGETHLGGARNLFQNPQSFLPLDAVPSELKRRIENSSSFYAVPSHLSKPVAFASSSSPSSPSQLSFLGGAAASKGGSSFQELKPEALSSSLFPPQYQGSSLRRRGKFHAGSVGTDALLHDEEKAPRALERASHYRTRGFGGSGCVEEALRDRLSRLRRIQLHDFQERLLHSQRHEEISRALGGGTGVSFASEQACLSTDLSRFGEEEFFPSLSRHSRGFQGAVSSHFRRVAQRALNGSSLGSHPYKTGSTGLTRFKESRNAQQSGTSTLPTSMNVESCLSDAAWNLPTKTDWTTRVF